jgi:anti-sigma B factor antagonist
MEIRRTDTGDVLELAITGRIDAMWAEHLQAVVAEAVRAGSLRIRADLSGVTFLSSAGVGALVAAYREVSARHGAFWVTNLTDKLAKGLEIVGLLEMLTVVPEATVAVRLVERSGAFFHVKGSATPPPLRLEAFGSPELLEGCRFTERDGARVSLTGTEIAVGVGAFGDGFEDARERFGELVSVAGAAIALPTDGSGAADFLLSGHGDAEVQLLYGLTCTGRLSAPAWFEAKKGTGLAIGEVAATALSLAGTDGVGFVVSGEPTALVGAALKRSPAAGEAPGAPFDFPDVRRWLSFTSEGGGARRALLVAGVAAKRAGALGAFLRPFAKTPELVGHVHGATFVLRQAPPRAETTADAVAALFEQGAPRGVLHLLADDRAGETELSRGTLWYAPLEIPS